jgi:hypothetical protein
VLQPTPSPVEVPSGQVWIEWENRTEETYAVTVLADGAESPAFGQVEPCSAHGMGVNVDPPFSIGIREWAQHPDEPGREVADERAWEEAGHRLLLVITEGGQVTLRTWTEQRVLLDAFCPAVDQDLLRDLLAVLPKEGTYLERLAACLRTWGWDAEVSEDGESLTYDYADESNRREFGLNKRACDVVVPPPPVVPLTDAEIRAVYRHFVKMRVCLADLGYATSEPPTEDEFVRTWATGPWSPYLDLPGRALERVEDTCPQSPPGVDD